MTDQPDDGRDPPAPLSAPGTAESAETDATETLEAAASGPSGAVTGTDAAPSETPAEPSGAAELAARAGGAEPAPAAESPVAESAAEMPAAAEGAVADRPTEAPAGAPPAAGDDAEALAEAVAEAVEEAVTETPPFSASEDVSLAGAEVPATGEQIEWQPVVTGDQIEWQPVMSSEAESASASAGEAGDYTPEVEYADQADAAWDGAAAPAAGSGSDGSVLAGGVSASSAGPPDPMASARRSGPGTAAYPDRAPTEPAGGEERPPPTPSSSSSSKAKTKVRRQVIILSVLSAVVLIVLVLGFVLSRGASKKGREAIVPTSTSVPIITVPASDLLSFRDEQTGFTVKYPKSWRQLGAPLSDIRLILDSGGNDAFQVRIFPIQTPATTDNITNLKAVTDTIVFGDAKGGKKEIQEQLVTLNGLLTYYYIYTFPDEVSGQEGVHVTYFVFEGHRMFELVFQAVPADDFRRLAGVFDQVAESFTVTPEAKLPSTTVAPTSAPPTTTG